MLHVWCRVNSGARESQCVMYLQLRSYSFIGINFVDAYLCYDQWVCDFGSTSLSNIFLLCNIWDRVIYSASFGVMRGANACHRIWIVCMVTSAGASQLIYQGVGSLRCGANN